MTHTPEKERVAARGARALFLRIEKLEAERDKLRKLDEEAATHVETVICMRTGFTGEPPYVGWKGLGLALTEALDERDALRAELERAREALRYAADACGDGGARYAREVLTEALANPSETPNGSAAMPPVTDEMVALCSRVPLPPHAITYDKGWELLDELQRIAVKAATARRTP